MLFVAGTALQRGEITHQLTIGMGRLARACAFVRTALPPLGLAPVEHADTLERASAADCAGVIERALAVGPPEPLSSAAHQALAIVAYEQPVTRADIERIRGVKSSGVIESLLAKRLVAEERRFGVRGGWVRERFTFGLFDEDGVAVLAQTQGERPAEHGQAVELLVRHYGAHAEIAERLAACVQAWDTAGRPSDDLLRIRVPADGTGDRLARHEALVPTPSARLVLTWATGDAKHGPTPKDSNAPTPTIPAPA